MTAGFAETAARSIAIRSYSSNIFAMSLDSRTGFNKLATTRREDIYEAVQHSPPNRILFLTWAGHLSTVSKFCVSS